MIDEVVNQMIAGWEAELQAVTHNPNIKLQPVMLRDMQFKITLEELAEVCAYAAEVQAKDLRGKSRKKEIMIGRQCFYYYAYNRGIANYAEIGEYLGGRDHTTVISGIRTLKDMLATEEPAYTSVFNLVDFYLKKLQENAQAKSDAN